MEPERILTGIQTPVTPGNCIPETKRGPLPTLLSRRTLGTRLAASKRLTVGMPAGHICITCGTQYPPQEVPPAQCPICLDERQYVGHQGQQWTTLPEMQAGPWRNRIEEQETDLIGIGTEPEFAIGQRALLVRTPQGNVLWDCLSYLDAQTVQAVQDLGGITALAISHPHYYSAMVEWSEAFGDVPIYLHQADKPWVQRPHPNIRFWTGTTKTLLDGVTLIHTGGHFDGFQVLHWAAGAKGQGALLAGDQPQVCADRKWVSFMYSYPNYIPLGPAAVRRVVALLEPWPFKRLYGFQWSRVVMQDAHLAVTRSAERYLQALAE